MPDRVGAASVPQFDALDRMSAHDTLPDAFRRWAMGERHQGAIDASFPLCSDRKSVGEVIGQTRARRAQGDGALMAEQVGR